jgi:hypothetical protein
MPHNYYRLKQLSDDELIEEFNKLAESAALGPVFFCEELVRRENEKLNEKMLKYTYDLAYFTKVITVLTVMSTLASLASVILSIIMILK